MASPQRHEWIDLLRGIAVVGMVWVHSANTLLESAQQAQPWYRNWGYYHGLIAPTFFWLAGLMRGMAVAGGRPQRPLWPTARRLLSILAVGYLLHLPQALMLPGGSWAERLQVLCQVDVLHCLAVSCLALLVVERMPRGSAFAVMGLLLGAVLAVPWATHASTGWALVDGYLNHQHGSLFPLFPWLGFAASGWLCGRFRASVPVLAVLGASLASAMPWVPGPMAHVWFFFERLGWVFMAAALLRGSAKLLLEGEQSRSLLRWLLLAGRESLVMYVAHLLLIYALPLPVKPLQQVLGPTLSLPQVVVVWLLVLLASLAVAWVAEARKIRQKPLPGV